MLQRCIEMGVPEVMTSADGMSGVAKPVIVLDEVSKIHVRGGRSTQVLDSVSLEVAAGDFVAVMGPSGSGKTTLLNLIGGLDRPSRGRVHVHGTALDRLDSRQLAKWRSSSVGFVFQFYNLIPVLTAQANVELPLSLQGESRARRAARAQAALELVGLDTRGSHYPNELSGGEQQRVAIARAIVGGPQLLLCDEPTGDLDRETGLAVMDLLGVLNREHGKTIVMVTHDPAMVAYAKRQIRLDKGVVSADAHA